MSESPSFVESLAHGVHVIDTGFQRPRYDASYLIVEAGRAAFIDTGTQHAVPRLLEALAQVGLPRDAVEFVIATHVHLDHAGGVGGLMQALPAARLVVHKPGARHLIDPSRLLDSARRVYGEAEVARCYGEMLAVPAHRVIETSDATMLSLAGWPLQFFDTPGHARHHHCIWDERSRAFFSGDTFGVAYPEFVNQNGPWLFPTTPPNQFEPTALQASIKRRLAFRPDRMYLTHYGAITPVQRLGNRLLEQLRTLVALGESLRSSPQRLDALKRGLGDFYLRELHHHGCTLTDTQALELIAIDIELNAQGMEFWLD